MRSARPWRAAVVIAGVIVQLPEISLPSASMVMMSLAETSSHVNPNGFTRNVPSDCL